MSTSRTAVATSLAALAAASALAAPAWAAGEAPIAGTRGASVFINLTRDWIQAIIVSDQKTSETTP